MEFDRFREPATEIKEVVRVLPRLVSFNFKSAPKLAVGLLIVSLLY